MLVVCSVLCADPFAQLPYPATAWIWQDWPWDLGSLHYYCSSYCSFGTPCNFLHAVLKMKPIFCGCCHPAYVCKSLVN